MKQYKVNRFTPENGIREAGLILVGKGNTLEKALRYHGLISGRDLILFHGKGLVVAVTQREKLLLDEIKEASAV